MSGERNARSYTDYLKIRELLGLQDRLTDAHDELQFIIVHQVFELWFKLLVSELDAVRRTMGEGHLTEALHHLRRIRSVIRLLTASFEVIETMRPHDFLEFRSRLMPASGFQSAQFREIEFLSGSRDPRYIDLMEEADRERLRKRIEEPTLWDAYVDLLDRNGLATDSEEGIVRSVAEVMKRPDDHPLGPLTEALVDYDELFSLWRARHVRMAMRMIGTRPGTGHADVERLAAAGYEQMGSGGVGYLESTLPKIFFPLLWQARTFLER